MEGLQEILRRPVITEKASKIRENNKFVLEVAPTATKHQIRQVVETRFKVNVVSLRTIKLHGKYRRRMGPTGGYQSDRKKAIVELKKGQQITWDEVV